jgi:hypothetical protein
LRDPEQAEKHKYCGHRNISFDWFIKREGGSLNTERGCSYVTTVPHVGSTKEIFATINPEMLTEYRVERTMFEAMPDKVEFISRDNATKSFAGRISKLENDLQI